MTDGDETIRTNPAHLQEGFACRLDWGRDGARRAADAGDILIVVDVLSFSTAAATGVHHGAAIHPCADGENAVELASLLRAEPAVGRADVPERGRFSLSPLSWLGAAEGTRAVLASPNGATCSRYAASVPALFVGALVNAGAVARAATEEASGSRAITVLACGERWPAAGEDGMLRFAIEDYLAAGAIIAGIDRPRSPEAETCAAAFGAVRNDLQRIIRECGSGRELAARGFGADVEHAVRLNLYNTAAVVREGWIVAQRM
ncbi:MAG TPA: 2-phosphosulfolactate phosphatase [Candidatus Kapabacteria bacterium]|nr:2-phosphosulfolactate phosphatase [Candidatus Kapabacteria bacterium]